MQSTNPTSPVFCIDCKHFEHNRTGYHTCASPKQQMTISNDYLITRTEPVTTRRWKYCSTQRDSGVSEGVCGPEGKHFEAAKPIKVAEFYGDSTASIQSVSS